MRKDILMTYMWQEGRGEKYYRFQTDGKEIAEKMRRRQKFILVGEGVNCDLWIFQATFTRPDIARKAFKSLTKGEIKFDDHEEIFFSTSILSDPGNYAVQIKRNARKPTLYCSKTTTPQLPTPAR